MGSRSGAAPRNGRGAGDEDVRGVLDALRRIVQALRGDTGARRSRVSSAQLFALQQIAEHPNVSINDVAALTFTHQSSVSVVIRRLVQRGLVAKTTSGDDRRRQSLTVTAAGRTLLRRTPAAVQERLVAALSSLSPAERRALARALAAVSSRVAPAGAAPPPMFFEDAAARRAPARRRRQP